MNTGQGTIFCREYVELLEGDVLSALMLSQIVSLYHSVQATGSAHLLVCKVDSGEPVWWIAKSHRDWFNELGMSHKQSRRCLDVLEQKRLAAESKRTKKSPKKK